MILPQECTAAHVVLANVCAQASLGNEDDVFSFDERWLIPTNNLFDNTHFLCS